MKKTLTLLALLGAVATSPLSAEDVWMKGVKWSYPTDPDYLEYRRIVEDNTAYTFSKDDADEHATNQCWAAAAADTLAWWQDRVEENGALIIHSGIPRGLELWKTLSPMFVTDGGYPNFAMNFWLFGNLPKGAPDTYLSKTWKAEHADFNGYFSHLKGQMGDPKDYAMIVTHSMLSSVRVEDDPESMAEAAASYAEKERQLIEMVKEGWGINFYTSSHAMAAYGMEINEEGHLTKLWYTDSNYNDRHGILQSTRLDSMKLVTEPGYYQNYQLWAYTGYGTNIKAFNAIRTTGIQFDTYELTMKGEATDEVLFSHYLDLVIDGATDYKLQYDLRNAKETGSPVTAKDNDGNLITTGDISLKKGQLSLVKGVEKYDGGGKTSGTITFDGSADTKRTLSVQHSATIAKEIKINAADGNTLEVTEGNTATIGKLTGEGNLDKTGKGAAKVTDTVELQGEIRVKEGDFIFGKDVELTGNTKLTVSEGARVQGAEGKAITLTIDSGVHVNDGVMTLTTTVNEGATLKGSGTFGMVAIDGGEMIVGNSPGHQDYEGALTLNSGKLVFCVSGFGGASEGDNVGWDSGTYSTINMNGNDFVVNENGEIVIAMSADAANSLTTANGTLELTLATGLQSGAFSEDQLAALAQQTSFALSLEDGAGTKEPTALTAPKFSYKMVNDALVLTTGTSGSPAAVPEPTTGTLGMLALAALAARRRRK